MPEYLFTAPGGFTKKRLQRIEVRLYCQAVHRDHENGHRHILLVQNDDVAKICLPRFPNVLLGRILKPRKVK
jgi:hypothetical protein